MHPLLVDIQQKEDLAMNSALEDGQMGKLRASYGNNRAHAMDLLGFIILFGLAGLAALVISFMQRRVPDKLLIVGIGLIPLAVGGRIFVAFRGRLRASAEVYDDGFVFTDGRNRRIPCRWDEVTEVYEKIVYQDTRRMRHPKWWTYTVCLADGRRIKLDNAIEKVRNLGATVHEEVGKRLLPQALASYKAGETVTFGPKIALRRKGLVFGQDIVMWEDVSKIKFSRMKSVEIYKDKRGAWKTIFHAKIANYPTFKALLHQAVESNPPSAQPAIHDPGLRPSPSAPRSNIGETSARLGFDVRELLRDGYTMQDVQGILEGEYDVHELRKRKPGKARRRKR